MWKESDDFFKFFFGIDSENVGFSGDSLMVDLDLIELILFFY